MEAMRPLGPQRKETTTGAAKPDLTLIEGGAVGEIWLTEPLPVEVAHWVPFVEDLVSRLESGDGEVYLDVLNLIGTSPDVPTMPSSAALIECMASHPNPQVRVAAASRLDLLPGAQDRRIFETAMQLFKEPELITEGVEALLINPAVLARSGIDKIIAAAKTRLWERQQALIEEFGQIAGRPPLNRTVNT